MSLDISSWLISRSLEGEIDLLELFPCHIRELIDPSLVGAGGVVVVLFDGISVFGEKVEPVDLLTLVSIVFLVLYPEF